MTHLDLLTLVAAFVLVLSAGGAAMRWMFGSDPDLEGEWFPGDAPDFRQR